MELVTEIIINAPPSTVWAVLMDFERYPEWNPFIVQIVGKAIVGERLSVRLQPPGTKGIRMRPTVLAVEPEREFRWKRTLAIPGVFSGEHRFYIEPHEAGSLFTQSECFSGLLVPLFRHSLDTDTRRGFEEMNRALLERSETLAGDAGVADT